MLATLEELQRDHHIMDMANAALRLPLTDSAGARAARLDTGKVARFA